jgi:hypothetical protein
MLCSLGWACALKCLRCCLWVLWTGLREVGDSRPDSSSVPPPSMPGVDLSRGVATAVPGERGLKGLLETLLPLGFKRGCCNTGGGGGGGLV